MTLLGKIRAVFLIASVVIGVLFAIAYGIAQEHFEQKLLDRFMQVAPFCRIQLPAAAPPSETAPPVQTGGFRRLSDAAVAHEAAASGRVVLVHTMPMGQVTLLRHRGEYLLRFRTPTGEQWLINTVPPPSPLPLLIWYGVSLAAVWLLYLWLVRSLAPLKTLHRAVERIKQGDLSVSTRNPRRDEIAQVANTLDDALRRIEALIDSRQLFLRAIMHELKTPIAKGKLLNTFLEPSGERERYEALFDRLDLLLGEFARIEQMLTASYTLRIAPYSAEDLLDHALELMLLDPDQITEQVRLEIEPGTSVKTDFNLFTLALKNLIDNALKHATDHRVTLTVTPTGWTISNRGTPLPAPLASFRKPFGGAVTGGLGLYIVLNIMETLRLELTYRHEEGHNLFTIRT